MKKIISQGVTFFSLLALTCMAGESELTGVLNKTVKVHSPYKLELDGATGSLYLRGDLLKDIPEETRIWVKGEIMTELYDSSVIEGNSVWPIHWQIFMEMKE